MACQQFALKWNNHTSNMISIFENLLSTETFVDVTLACDGLSLKAHKIVLSASSPFFQNLFSENPCKHPIVIMNGISYQDLKSIVEFMYHGEMNVPQHQLPALLKTADMLKIKGLTEVPQSSQEVSTPVPQAASTPRSVPFNSSQPHFKENVSHATPMHAKRKRVRSGKRSYDSSSNDDVVPIEMDTPQSPKIKEIVEVAENVASNDSMLSRPGPLYATGHSFSSKSHSSEAQDFGNVYPSPLMVQTLTTESIPSRSASHGNVPMQSHLPEVRDSRSTPVSQLSDASQSPGVGHGSVSLHDVDPVRFESQVGETSQSTLDLSQPGPSQEPDGQEDNAMVPQGEQPRAFKLA